jgi:hypothetical protein
MRFVLVNDRTPRITVTCAACSRLLEDGFLHDLSTHGRYCGIGCYPGQASNNQAFHWIAETNPFVLTFGWPQLTADAVSVLFDYTLRDSVR